MQRILLSATAGAMTLGAAHAHAGRDAEAPAPPLFLSCEKILDADVTSKFDRESTADLDDLVVDTRNGRAVFAIIDTNGILGSDDKTVAIPYGALSWSPSHESFMLDVSAEELKNLPECDPKKLAHLESESWFSTLRGIFGDRQELRDAAEMRGDEYTWHFTQTRPESMAGEIVAINRQAKTARGATCYAVVVGDERGQQHTVFLGPLDYLTKQSCVPSEGQKVTVTAIEAINADGEIVYVARTIRADGKNLRLRDDKGVPAWQMADDARRSQSFCMLASEMDKGSLHAQGDEFGSVDDVVFEVHSGTAAFAIVSVGGLLGVDDTLYPVPCGAFAAGGEGHLYVDMPMSRLKLAPKLSDDGVDDLNTPQYAQRVCEFFGVKPKQFDTGRSAQWPARQHASGN